MDIILERFGVLLAQLIGLYGLTLLLAPTLLFGHLTVLALLVWSAIARARSRQLWRFVPPRLRNAARLLVEIIYGLINPVIYLTILPGQMSELRTGIDTWLLESLKVAAWALLTAIWTVRIFGGAFDPAAPRVRRGVRIVLAAGLVCLAAFALKDLRGAFQTITMNALTSGLMLLPRIAPLYLIPALLLWQACRAWSPARHEDDLERRRLFVLPGRAARVAVALVVLTGAAAIGLAAYRRSDTAVRAIIDQHRQAIADASRRYGVDARLIASIIYVTHRDQLSPFRAELERVVAGAWAGRLRSEPPGPRRGLASLRMETAQLLNRTLDISLGVTQVKPRTAQTASLLATNLIPGRVPSELTSLYRDVEPAGSAWTPGGTRSMESPIPIPADRAEVVGRLLQDDANIATCAMILALYQDQWERANPAWSLRQRPEILATLYQIGFSRSRPHDQPRSNAFGARVKEIYEAPWMRDELGAPVPQIASR